MSPIEWHTYVDLDLNEIGNNKSIALCIGCMVPLGMTNPTCITHIAYIDEDDESSEPNASNNIFLLDEL